MANFADLTARLNLNIQNFANNIQNAAKLADKFAKNLNGKINSGITEPAKKAGMQFKDVGRIVQGILISQVFYRSINAITSAAKAVFDFSAELENANIAYNNLFGNTQVATEFINVLKDFAAETPFTFQQANAAAKRLLAYGVEYKNVMYVMQGVLAASTMSGDAQSVESVSRALGQIYTKGKLMNEEMRQLAEAGIPAYEILQEKLNLTADQMANIGKQAIPAHIAINALVDGMQERFGGVLGASSKTMTGIISNLVDNASMLFQGLFSGAFNRLKGFIDGIAQQVAKLRQAFDISGIGGVFETLIPPELQGTIRQLIANFLNLWTIVKHAATAFIQLLKPALIAVAQALNVLMPIITTILDVLVRTVKWITANQKAMQVITAVILGAAAAWLIYKAQALAAAVTTAVITGISKAVAGLGKMLNFIVAHPVWSLLALGVGLLIGLSGGFGKLSDAIGSMFKSLTSFNGVDPDKLLLPSQKERTADLEKFNKRLGDTGDAMSDLADETGKATKAAKGLLSFDEVFKLKEPDEGAEGIDAGWGDFELPDFSGLGDAILPEMPDFTGFATDFVDNFLAAIGGKEKLLSVGIGALLGAAIGGILGGPVGAKIGAAIGGLAGWVWDELANALGMSDYTQFSLLIGTGLGAAIGAIAGGPLGALIGGAIGTLVGWITGLLIDGFADGNWNIAGLSIGIGTGIGAAIGFIAGGPVGAAIGAAIGALVGWIADLIIENWEAISGFFAGLWDGIAGFFSGIWEKIYESVSGFFSVVQEMWTTGWEWLSGVFEAVFGPIIAAIKTVFNDVKDAVVRVVTDIFEAVSTIFNDILSAISFVVGEIWTVVTNVFNLVKDIIIKVSTEIWQAVSEWFGKVFSTISKALQDVWDAVVRVFQPVFDFISETVRGIWEAVSEWFGKIFSTISEVVKNVWSNVTEWFKKIYTGVKDTIQGLYNSVKDIFTNIYNTIKNIVQNIWDHTLGKFFGWINDGINKLRDFIGLGNASSSVNTNRTSGHATGGIFNREHIAAFAEGNKAEAVIPLENASAMQPFVDAIANGITSALLPVMATAGAGNRGETQLPPMMVGTLVADERGLKELYKKFQLYSIQEDARRGND